MTATLGVQMYTLRRHTQDLQNLDRCLARVREIGYRSIQVSAFGDIPAEQVARLCAKHDLVAGGGDPVAWIEACGQRMPLLHLKDFSLNPEFKRTFAAIGEGNMNWPAILAAAANQPIEYCFVEQDDCYGADEFDCLARSYRYLTAQGLH